MKKTLMLIAVVTATSLIGLTATNASAATGRGIVYNQVASNGKFIAKGDGGQLADVWAGRSSEWMGIWDADYFWVPGGCDAWSTYGYKYVGNRWYGPLPNGTVLSLKVVC